MPNKIDSNVTGLAFAEEVIGSPKTLPGTPVWYGMEPNSYSDFGGQVATVAREPINPSRQLQKGSVTDLDASGGFNTDVTQNNLTRLLQGFMFADIREKFDTIPINGAAITMTATTTTTYTAASGLASFLPGDLVFASGFTNAANNGLKALSATAAGSVTTTGNVVETPPAGAKLQACGFQFASGDATLTVASGVLTLGATTKNLTQLNLNVGEWIFIGGDAVGERPATSPVGYARVATISATAITFDKVTAAFVTDACAGKTIRIFFGKFLKNESTSALIKTRTYNLERQLGNDGSGVQSEYLEGAIPNELKLNIPQADKMSADLGFIAMNNAFRNGVTGIKSGTRVAALGEGAFNTSSNVYRVRMNILAPGTLQPTALFGYITEASININNNASLAKAVGTLGGIDTVVGNFQVTGNVTAYFTDTAAVAAVRNNSDVTLDMILAKSNAGIVVDLPLLALGGGRITVQKDQAITVPLDTLAAQGAAGYTLGITNLPYLPTIATP